jgi:hypothetical protein
MACGGGQFAGGSFALMPGGELRGIIDLCHQHGVKVRLRGAKGFVQAQWPPCLPCARGPCTCGPPRTGR